ncbi:prolipoprotein diacylglyceryl transferase [Microbacterium oryzae]|uniref:prolipoprotein diacylglyceryl transferase n=1 Tax=Microbacterium oryzae TaxID=743009 RepID=UPI0025AEEB6D|nr:prolipoprotein diacylglyceryl transferase [Microbacterium oryzae]MDN3312117.1 prolipoprotein diacylglyceryl transferase [Microbacterium oryzae]
MLSSALTSVVASIPSPAVSYIDLGPLRIHFYALCIILGIVVATLITNHRLTRRGAEPWVVIDIALLAVPLAIIGARIYHVLTHWGFYFGAGANPWNPTQPGSVWAIWEGGIAIFGALIGGAVGAWLGCKWTGIRFWTFADALAPAILLAQALGRFGNWFNQELFGWPTDVPWGLEIDPDNAAFPAGLPDDTLFHPTFLYEVIWNVLGVIVLFVLGRKLFFRWGRLFAIYLVWYGAGRVVWESIRIDPSEVILGLRTNVWGAIAAIVIGLAILVVQSRHKGIEPSPYRPGRESHGADAVQSQGDFVDVSEPPASTVASTPSPQAP